MAGKGKPRGILSPLVPVKSEVVAALIRKDPRPIAAVAKAAGMSRPTLSYIAAGRNTRMRQNERARLANALGVGVKVLTGERPITASVRPGEVLPAWYLLQREGAAETFAEVFRTADPNIEYRLNYVFDVATWRRFLGDTYGWENPPAATREERNDFAEALFKALRVALEPWRSTGDPVGGDGPRLVLLFWQALVAVFYAQMRTPEELESLAERVAGEFERAITASPAAV